MFIIALFMSNFPYRDDPESACFRSGQRGTLSPEPRPFPFIIGPCGHRRFTAPMSENYEAWFSAYLKTRGFRDDLADRLAARKKEDPRTDRDDILTFMDYIEVDEGRELQTRSRT